MAQLLRRLPLGAGVGADNLDADPAERIVRPVEVVVAEDNFGIRIKEILAKP